MELYIGAAATDRRVYLTTPATPNIGTMNVTCSRGEETVNIQTVVLETDGRYRITIPYYLTIEEGVVSVNWSFIYEENSTVHVFNKTDDIHLVTPYVDLNEVQTILGSNENFTAAEIEKAVRYVINAYCGQSFGKRFDTLLVPGTGEKRLHLPERLIDLMTIEPYGFGYKVYDKTVIVDDTWPGKDWFQVHGDGWFLQGGNWLGEGVKSDSYGYYSVTGPIYNPYGNRTGIYGVGRPLYIGGTWGWQEVPHEVTEAAKLLINDYACDEGLYRDRYVGNMKAADWRIEFNEGTFARTGNVRADQLLSKYVIRRGWGII